MILAAIDIGTNSTRLMIGKLDEDNNLTSLYRDAKITRLGEGVNQNLFLNDNAITRTLETIAFYRNIAVQYEVEKIIGAATSAVRDAKNSEKFLKQVKEISGFNITVLSGEEEAQISFEGATYDLFDEDSAIQVLSAQPVLVLDIGGGSTELILGSPPRIWNKYSLDIGCVRISELFLKSDPPSANEIEIAREHVDKMLLRIAENIKKEVNDRRASSISLVGVAGTITTISAVKQQMEIYNPDKIHHSILNYSDVNNALRLFLSVPLAKRREIIGLEPKRADVIIAGALIARLILEVFNLREIIVSEHDILDGLILRYSHFK